MMKNYILSVFTLIAMGSGLLAQNIQILSPTDDTYAFGGSSSEIYNVTNPSEMWVKTGSTAAFTRIGFIKFDITGITLEEVGTAKLRLFCYESQSNDIQISVFNIEEDWSEATLNWTNQPLMITPAIRTEQVVENGYMEWQVSALLKEAIIQGRTSISLGLSGSTGSNNLARFYTKDASSSSTPQLTINNQIENYQALSTVADAMVIGGSSADINYGSVTGIQVKAGSSNNSFVKQGLLKFDLNQINSSEVSTVGTARLKLYFTSTNADTPNIDVSILADDSNWDESTVTWNNFPSITNLTSLRTTQVLADQMDRYYEWDISAHVIAKLAETSFDGILSLAVLDLAGVNNGATFNSKEAADFYPVLELLEELTNIPPDNTPISGIYYVDALNGDDSNNGLSIATAWKTLSKVNDETFGAGARVLFKTGQSWTGTLKLKGSGAPENPIIIASYGQEAKPILHGSGALETIHLENNAYVEIRNLEITNYNPSEENGLSMEAWEAKNTTDWFDNPQAGNDLTPNTNKVGVRVTAQDLGEVNHIHLVNLDIHGINGNNDDKDNGGIYMEIMGTLVPTYYNGFLVEGCHIYDVDRTGLSNVSTWDVRTMTDNGNWTPTLNFIVRNNVFERTGANALILRNAKNPLIEHNLFHQCAIKGSGNAAFNFNTDGAIFQYNEARFTKANIGDEDAGGLDSDFRTKNTILQYNYLHDNDYGMLATGGGFATSFNDNTIFRYNIIERDGLVARENGEKFVFKLSGQITNTKYHNNVIYLSPEQEGVDLMFHKLWRGKPANTEYYNNIYYLEGANHKYNLQTSTGNAFSNNLFHIKGTNITVPNDAQAITADPLFIAFGTGPQGYKLTENSPAIGSGKEIIENADTDYFGNAVPVSGAIDRGLHQFASINNENTPGGFSKSEFDVYLLIGQSNMAGRGEIGVLDQETLQNAYLFDGTTWENAEVPLNKHSTVRKGLEHQKMNPAYTFARKLSEYTNRGIGLVVNARGGTNIEQWQKGYSGTEDFDLYEQAVSSLLAAKDAGNFKGIIWHQGESNQNSNSSYMEKLKQLVHDLRTDLGTNAFFVAGEINQWRSASEPMNNVIRSIANDINQASYIKSDDLAPINGDLEDPHFDGFSQRVLGGLYADEILENVYGMSTGVASLYSKCDFQGYKVRLRPGIYNLEELEKRGVIDNDIRSLQIDSGYEVLLYTGQQDGQSALIPMSKNCLTDTDVNENVSFIVIGKTGTTDEMLSTKKVDMELGDVIISPNPAKKKIKINFPSNFDVARLSTVQLIDLQGRMIKLEIGNSASNNGAMEFDLTYLNLNSGLYIIKLITPDQIFNKKLVIQ